MSASDAGRRSRCRMPPVVSPLRERNNRAEVLMLIDTHDDSREPGGHGRRPWPLVVADWLFPWPAAIVWLIAAALMTDGLLGVGLAWSACGLTGWRLQRAFRGV